MRSRRGVVRQRPEEPRCGAGWGSLRGLPPMGRRRPGMPLPVLTTALIHARCPCSPLLGQGVPDGSTKVVYVSVYLDRLIQGGPLWAVRLGQAALRRESTLVAATGCAARRVFTHCSPTMPAVDDKRYQHESILHFFISWTDITAAKTVTANRQRQIMTGKNCECATIGLTVRCRPATRREGWAT